MACNSKQYDITIEQGVDFSKTITWKRNDQPVNLGSIVFVGGIASDFESATPIADFNYTVVNVTGGIFAFSLPASATALMEGNAVINKSQKMTHLGVYNIDWSDGVNTGRLIEGKVSVSREAV